METGIGEYLNPTNPHASWLVGFLKFLFFIWAIGLISYAVWLIAKRIQIGRLEDVRALAEARSEQNPELDDSAHRDAGDEVFREFYLSKFAETSKFAKHFRAVFRRFCSSKSLPETSHIAKHFRAVFLAGWSETRLEPGELIDHTTSYLLRFNGLVRSVLAIFIVIGLLGTLFGLADSLTDLAPALKQGATDADAAENAAKMTEALRKLLGSMKGALAPSIWGIGFTIFGVIFYGIHVQAVCHPIKSRLERLTLTIWIPQLYPTTSQKLIHTLQQSEQQMRRGYDTASRVGELVETVQDNISEFNQNLSRANAITQPLGDSASQIHLAASALNENFAQSLTTFLRTFGENVTRLTGFQDDIRTLYQQLIDESMVFQAGANHRLDEQNQNLNEMLRALQSYEDAYVASRHRLDESLRQFITEATEANTSLNAANRQSLESIQEQLKSDLKGLQTALHDQLRALVNRFDRFDVPLQEAAKQIATIVDSFARIAERIARDVQVENRQQNEANRDQLHEIADLKRQILSLLSQMDRNSVNQKTAIGELSENVETLTEGVQPLAESIRSLSSDSGVFSTSVVAIQDHVVSIGEASRQMIESADKSTQSLAAGTDTLGRSVDSIGERVENLGRISQQLSERVGTAASSLASDSASLREAIESIESHVESVGTGFRQLVDGADSATQSLTSNAGAFSRSIDAIEKNLESLSATARAVETVVEAFGSTSRQVVEKADDTAQSLISSSAALSSSMGAIEGHVETLGMTSRQLVEKADVTALTTEIEELRNAIGEIVQHSKTLADFAQRAATKRDSWLPFGKKQ